MKTDPETYILAGNNKGFTLIETLIAMAIFSIGILALGSMLGADLQVALLHIVDAL